MDGFEALIRLYQYFGLICLKPRPFDPWPRRGLIVLLQIMWWIVYNGSFGFLMAQRVQQFSTTNPPDVALKFGVYLHFMWLLQNFSNHVLYWFKRDTLHEIVHRLRRVHATIQRFDGGSLRGQRFTAIGLIVLSLSKIVLYEASGLSLHPEYLRWSNIIPIIVHRLNVKIGTFTDVLLMYFSVYFRGLIKRLALCLAHGARIEFVLEKLTSIEETFNELAHHLSLLILISYSFQSICCIAYPFLLLSRWHIYTTDSVIKWSIDQICTIVLSVMLADTVERERQNLLEALRRAWRMCHPKDKVSLDR